MESNTTLLKFSVSDNDSFDLDEIVDLERDFPEIYERNWGWYRDQRALAHIAKPRKEPSPSFTSLAETSFRNMVASFLGPERAGNVFVGAEHSRADTRSGATGDGAHLPRATSIESPAHAQLAALSQPTESEASVIQPVEHHDEPAIRDASELELQADRPTQQEE